MQAHKNKKIRDSLSLPVGISVDVHSGSLLENYFVDGATLQAAYLLDIHYVAHVKHYFMTYFVKIMVVASRCA
jgi:hypothetical protein